MKYSHGEIVRRSIANSIKYEQDWLLAMENCNSEEVQAAKKETVEFIKASQKYYRERFGENP